MSLQPLWLSGNSYNLKIHTLHKWITWIYIIQWEHLKWAVGNLNINQLKHAQYFILGQFILSGNVHTFVNVWKHLIYRLRSTTFWYQPASSLCAALQIYLPVISMFFYLKVKTRWYFYSKMDWLRGDQVKTKASLQQIFHRDVFPSCLLFFSLQHSAAENKRSRENWVIVLFCQTQHQWLLGKVDSR